MKKLDFFCFFRKCHENKTHSYQAFFFSFTQRYSIIKSEIMEYVYNFLKKKALAFDTKWFSNIEKNPIRAARFFLREFLNNHIFFVF